MTGRRAVVSMITTMSILLLSAPLGAQVSLRDRDPNPALRQGTIDPAALGLGGRGFLEFSEGEQFDWMAAAGLGLFGGTLRASYGYEQNFSQRIYGLGYARAITQTDMGLFGTLGTGVDLSAAYSSSRYLSHYAPRAVQLAVPLSLRWGSPSGLSVSPYVAPYAEIGRADLVPGGCGLTCPPGVGVSPGRTYSTGLGAGAVLTAWRLSLEAGMIGVPTRLNLYRSGWKASAGIRWGF